MVTQGAFEDDGNVYLVMELCEGGSLLSRVAKGQETERSIANIARSILRFIAQCHARVGHLQPIARKSSDVTACASIRVLFIGT